jgi:DNA-binding NarL/FixJ family response regulator
MIQAIVQPIGYELDYGSQAEGPRHRERQSILPDPADCQASRTASSIKVLIVEDSPIVRERLAALITEVRNVAIVGQAGDGFQAQDLFRRHRPDAVVLDIQLPGINGMDLLEQFKREHPACVVMMLTTYAFKEFRQRCIALGADHFFDKSTEFERVPEVLGAFERRVS